MEFSKSQKGNEVLTFQGFEYTKYRESQRRVNNENKKVITWRCRQYHSKSANCKAMLRTSEDKNLIGKVQVHSHESCPQKSKANILKSRMKEEMKNIGTTASNVIGSLLNGVTSETMNYLPKPSSLKRNLLKHRSTKHLPNPTTCNFAIPQNYLEVVLHDSGEDDPNRILVIGDKELLMELDKDTIYGDGTFDEYPNMFYQLYTWHAKVGRSYLPCVYFLLQKKNLATYSRMFVILKELLPKLSPQKVLVDFEKDIISAALIAFPHSEIKGCYFHLCQNLIRKIRSVGLKTDFESDIQTKLQLKSLAALAFVPIQEVKSVFNTLATTFPEEDRYNEILTYFFYTYIEGAAGRDPQFPVRMWNQYEAAAEKVPKTINCCERFHNSLNAIFHCTHLSIWLLFDKLKIDMVNKKLLLTKVQQGRPKIKKFDNLHQQVTIIVHGYQDELDKLTYLRKLANLQ